MTDRPTFHVRQGTAAELLDLSPNQLGTWKHRGYVRASLAVPGLRRPCLSLPDLVQVGVMVRLVEQDIDHERASVLARVLVDQELVRLTRDAGATGGLDGDSYLVYAVNPRLPVRDQVFLDIAVGVEALNKITAGWEYRKYPVRMEVSLGAIISEMLDRIKAMQAAGRFNSDQEMAIAAAELLDAPIAGRA